MKTRKLLTLVVSMMVLTFTLWGCSENPMEPNTDTGNVSDMISAPMPLEENGALIPGQYIVVMKKDSKSGQLRSAEAVRAQAEMILAENNISTNSIDRVYSQALTGFVGKLSENEAANLALDSRIDYIEQDKIMILKRPGNGGGGGGPQITPWGITRVNGGVAYSGSNVAWIIDTGIDLDHEDLNVDASLGFSAWASGPNATFEDLNGHGSHVAGTIAALDNSVGVIGVAAGATVIPVKVLDRRGSGSYSGVIAGVEHVAANGSNGDVANMSLGGPVSEALDDAVLAASQNGIKFCLAAGNESDDANNHSPARVNGSNIYTISAMNSNDDWASFSNYGNPPVDYCEPGVSIESTWKNGGYNTISGTSMASPHAAGILLLGNISNGGTVNGDPDGDDDTIGVN